MHDLVIRNALLLDGLGSPARHGELAVSDGKIVPVSGKGKEEIDAQGLALMPGIIDNHTHYDAQITWDPWASPSPSLGVTTAVIGNCGFTIAPCRASDRELVMKNLTQVEGMSLAALRAGIRWEFESLPEYLDMLERRGAAINLACFAGHSSIRTYVMGAAASERAATPEEVSSMKRILQEALQAGAIGLSSTTSPAHNGEGGRPMPSRLAEESELRALVGCLREAGRGLFMLTKGGQTRIDFLESLAAESTRPVVVAALLHSSTNPDAVFQDLQKIKEANDRGHRLLGAVSCCPLSMEFTLHSPYVLEGLESWKPALGKKGAEFRKVISQKAFRDGVRAELSKPAHFRIFNGEWHKVQVVAAQRTIAELAGDADPLDYMLDLGLKENLDTVFNALLLNSDEEAVGRMLRHPNSLVSLSDAGAHLTFFNDAGFGLQLLGHWVRELGVLDLPEAAWRLTGHPAKVFGITERGALKPGYRADLFLFDPAKVGRGPALHARDLPAGEPRLVAQAAGVHGVWVNGTRIVGSDGQRSSDALPGELLRRFAA